MGIKKYYATKDNTITNAFKIDLLTRGTGSNMGAADILEAFVIHGQTSASINAGNAEQSRFMIQFPISTISSDMVAGVIPNDTASLKFYLNLYNAPHGSTLPSDFELDVKMLEQAWTEGTGLDMDNYSDLGVSNWISSSEGVAWNATGSSYLYGAGTSASSDFETGLENMRLDVSDLVYKWLDATDNYGFLVKFPDSIVSGSISKYTKKFFSRTSEYFHYRPTLEVWWDSTRTDNRGNFMISSSLAPASDNLNTLFLYNVVRGQLQNIPGLDSNTLSVEIFSGSQAVTVPVVPTGSALDVVRSDGTTSTMVTGGILFQNGVPVTGVYTASFASTSSFDQIFDVWSTGSGAQRVEFYTGSYVPKTLQTADLQYDVKYVTAISNLQSSYPQGEVVTLRAFTRKKDWSPNIYTVATKEIVPEIIDNAYYKIFRVIDNLDVIPYGTGSQNNYYSRLSYDVSGNYFDIDTSYLEPGYAYGIKFSYYLQGTYQEQPEVFKFRIEEEDI